jgi:hypothetical protein
MHLASQNNVHSIDSVLHRIYWYQHASECGARLDAIRCVRNETGLSKGRRLNAGRPDDPDRALVSRPIVGLGMLSLYLTTIYYYYPLKQLRPGGRTIDDWTSGCADDTVEKQLL